MYKVELEMSNDQRSFGVYDTFEEAKREYHRLIGWSLTEGRMTTFPVVPWGVWFKDLRGPRPTVVDFFEIEGVHDER